MLLDKGCLVDMEVFLAAFRFHSLEFIQGLADNYIDVLEVSPRPCLEAIHLDRLDVLVWLRARDWPLDHDCFVATVFAAGAAMMRFVLEDGCPAQDVCWHAIHAQQLRHLQVALELGFVCDEMAAEEALHMYRIYAFHPSGPWLAATDILVYVLQLDTPVPVKYLEPDESLLAEMEGWSAAVLGLLDFRKRVRRFTRARAARVIQARWLHCYYTPTEPVCRKRLTREFEEEEPGLRRVRV